MRKYEQEFRIDKPETVGEIDKYFDLDNYKDWLEDQLTDCRKQLSIQRVVFNEAEIDEDIIVNVPHKSLGKYSIKKIEDSEVELCECNWPLIRTGTKERPEYCGNCEKDI